MPIKVLFIPQYLLSGERFFVFLISAFVCILIPIVFGEIKMKQPFMQLELKKAVHSELFCEFDCLYTMPNNLCPIILLF